MKALKTILLIVSLTVFWVGCRKDNVTIEKEFLTSVKWKIVSAKVNGIESVKDCDKDDLLIFNTDGTFTYHPGSLVCTEGQTGMTGTYRFSENEAQVSITINKKVIPFSISRINNEGLLLTITDEKDLIEISLERH